MSSTEAAALANWPPIMCPRCWAMKFITYPWIAQCVYCGFNLSFRRKC